MDTTLARLSLASHKEQWDQMQEDEKLLMQFFYSADRAASIRKALDNIASRPVLSGDQRVYGVFASLAWMCIPSNRRKSVNEIHVTATFNDTIVITGWSERRLRPILKLVDEDEVACIWNGALEHAAFFPIICKLIKEDVDTIAQKWRVKLSIDETGKVPRTQNSIEALKDRVVIAIMSKQTVRFDNTKAAMEKLHAIRTSSGDSAEYNSAVETCFRSAALYDMLCNGSLLAWKAISEVVQVTDEKRIEIYKSLLVETQGDIAYVPTVAFYNRVLAGNPAREHERTDDVRVCLGMTPLKAILFSPEITTKKRFTLTVESSPEYIAFSRFCVLMSLPPSERMGARGCRYECNVMRNLKKTWEAEGKLDDERTWGFVSCMRILTRFACQGNDDKEEEEAALIVPDTMSRATLVKNMAKCFTISETHFHAKDPQTEICLYGVNVRLPRYNNGLAGSRKTIFDKTHAFGADIARTRVENVIGGKLVDAATGKEEVRMVFESPLENTLPMDEFTTRIEMFNPPLGGQMVRFIAKDPHLNREMSIQDAVATTRVECYSIGLCRALFQEIKDQLTLNADSLVEYWAGAIARVLNGMEEYRPRVVASTNYMITNLNMYDPKKMTRVLFMDFLLGIHDTVATPGVAYLYRQEIAGVLAKSLSSTYAYPLIARKDGYRLSDDWKEWVADGSASNSNTAYTDENKFSSDTVEGAKQAWLKLCKTYT
jgi:hypothetical protein